MLMTVFFWGVNVSVIKIGLRELAPHAFNAVRLTLASVAYLAVFAFGRRRFALAKGDGWKAVGLGVLGITAYQLFFIEAISVSSASTAAIIMATSPIFIALLSTALGQERITWAGWLGIFISFAGFFLVAAGAHGGQALTWSGMRGAIFILLANVCWAAYTVFSKPVLERNSPFGLAALSTAAGTALYLPFAARDIASAAWQRLSWAEWGAVLYCGLISITFCFFIWYDSVAEGRQLQDGRLQQPDAHFRRRLRRVLPRRAPDGVSKRPAAAVVLAGVYLTRSGYRFFERRPAAENPVDISGPNS